MSNQVVLTFAGEDSDLERAFSRVGKSSEEMSRKVHKSSEEFGSAGQNVGKFREGVEAAGKLAVPAAATSAALLGAAVAPALAAALAGGVVLALGGGVLVAGIASAAKDSSVLKAFTGLKTQASKLFADFGKPFVGPLRTSVQFITTKLAGWAKYIDPLAQKFAPVITAFSRGLAGLVDNALPGIASAAGGAVPSFEKLATFLPTIGTWIGKIVTKMAELFQWGIKNKDSIGAFIKVVAPIVGIFLAIVGAIRVWIAVQTILNVVMSLNPIGLIVLAIIALVAIIVVIATKTHWFQDIWKTVWGAIKTAASAVGSWFKDTLWGKWIKGSFDNIKSKAESVLTWFKGMPGKLKSAFASVANFLFAPFRTAFNRVSDAWNNTIGRLRWSVPGWIPGIGGDSISAPTLPHFHSGGVVGGVPGSEQLAVLQAGETVLPVSSSGGNTVIEIHSGGTPLDDLLVEILSRAIRRRGGNTQLVLGGRNA